MFLRENNTTLLNQTDKSSYTPILHSASTPNREILLLLLGNK